MRALIWRLRYVVIGVSIAVGIGSSVGLAVVGQLRGGLPWTLESLGIASAAVLGAFAVVGLRDSDRKGKRIADLERQQDFWSTSFETHVEAQHVTNMNVGGSLSAAFSRLAELAADEETPIWRKQEIEAVRELEAKGFFEAKGFTAPTDETRSGS